MAAKKGNTIELVQPNAKGTPIADAERSPEALAKIKKNRAKAGAARKKQVDQIGNKLVLTHFTYATKEVAAIRMKNATFRITGLTELTRDNGGTRVDSRGRLEIVDPVKTKSIKISYAMKNRNVFSKQKDSAGKVTKTLKKTVYDYKWLTVSVPVNASELDIIGWTSAFAKSPIAISVHGKILKFKGGADIYSKIKKRVDVKSDAAK
jgi:hypothetical protein